MSDEILVTTDLQAAARDVAKASWNAKMDGNIGQYGFLSFKHADDLASAYLAAVARIAELESESKRLRDEADGLGGCLDMIADFLKKVGCQCTPSAHDTTPPMMYPEWIACAINARSRQMTQAANARIAELEAGLSRGRG